MDGMEVNLLFFGALRELVGHDQLRMDVPDAETVHGLLKMLSSRFPKLASHKLLFAINQEYVGVDTQLNTGDEVAIFTAVSGG